MEMINRAFEDAAAFQAFRQGLETRAALAQAEAAAQALRKALGSEVVQVGLDKGSGQDQGVIVTFERGVMVKAEVVLMPGQSNRLGHAFHLEPLPPKRKGENRKQYRARVYGRQQRDRA